MSDYLSDRGFLVAGLLSIGFFLFISSNPLSFGSGVTPNYDVDGESCAKTGQNIFTCDFKHNIDNFEDFNGSIIYEYQRDSRLSINGAFDFLQREGVLERTDNDEAIFYENEWSGDCSAKIGFEDEDLIVYEVRVPGELDGDYALGCRIDDVSYSDIEVLEHNKRDVYREDAGIKDLLPGLRSEYGSVTYNLYEDSDGDGVKDSKDECPNEPGEKANGCPKVFDRDGDGVPNTADVCPDEAGELDNGCPKPNKPESTSLTQILFEILVLLPGVSIE